MGKQSGLDKFGSLEPVEEELAKQRQREAGKRYGKGHSSCSNEQQLSEGYARDIAARKARVSSSRRAVLGWLVAEPGGVAISVFLSKWEGSEVELNNVLYSLVDKGLARNARGVIHVTDAGRQEFREFREFRELREGGGGG